MRLKVGEKRSMMARQTFYQNRVQNEKNRHELAGMGNSITMLTDFLTC